ncbi:MAG: prepilin-type N-terminal cleavage/methylation domain-containing protein [Nitrosomonas sp.]|nr:prepilin-type N-terminal cleavage/methylation domain-containing protein [Nitrosomonas sp.]MCW5608847.1 prepilin-type N-terminal cleavage/methylation domain-containing protein [Nitrosomonas sp.]
MKFLKRNGFTLIELMILVSIASILITMAYPSYMQYATKASRAAAQSEMMAIADRQQRFLLTHRAYADKSTLEANGYFLPANVSTRYSYAIVLGKGAAPSFTLIFTPIGAQAGDGDLMLASSGVKTPIDKW